jgi:hypothetical protein
MNTLIKESLSRKKVPREDYSIPRNPTTLKLVPNELVNSRSNLKNATDLFKDNADFISYGISTMTIPF